MTIITNAPVPGKAAQNRKAPRAANSEGLTTDTTTSSDFKADGLDGKEFLGLQLQFKQARWLLHRSNPKDGIVAFFAIEAWPRFAFVFVYQEDVHRFLALIRGVAK